MKLISVYDFGIGEDFSYMTIRGPTVEEKVNKFNYIKVKNCSSKDTVNIFLKRLQIENREQISTKMSQRHFTKGNERAHMSVERYSLVTMGNSTKITGRPSSVLSGLARMKELENTRRKC